MKRHVFEWNKSKYTVDYITTLEEVNYALKQIEKSPSKLYGADIETGKIGEYKTHDKAGLCPHLSFIRLLQIYSPNESKVYVFDIRRINKILPRSLVEFMSSQKFIAHNAIFEIKHFAHQGIEIDCVCSMIMAQFVETANHSPFEPQDEEAELKYRPTKGFGLMPLIQKYFGLAIPKEQQISNWNKKVLSKEQILYAALDAVLTYKLGKHLYPEIKKLKMGKAFKQYKQMQYVIADMELNGMGIEKKAHNDLMAEWAQKLHWAEQHCNTWFDGVNLRSPKQLHEWVENNIDDKLKKLWPRSAKTQNFSFNKTQLLPLVDKCDALKPFMEYKKYATLLSTFGQSLQKKINPKTGRLHSSFSLGHTRTGRLSSRDPNLQNQPSRGDSFKHIFIAAKGYYLVVADFSQIEIRVAGELSKDPVIRKAYKDGLDLHKAIVAELENKPIAEVTKQERFLGKAINFGLEFGMGPKKLAFYAKTSYGVDMSEQEAQRAWETYHTKYHVYSKWCNTQRTKAQSVGWVRTPMGKVRKLADGEYYTKAVNTPVQGGAAEVMFASNIKLRQMLKGTDIKFINVVHDECILECKKQDIPDAISLLETSMLYGFKQIFPNGISRGLVEANSGKTWGDAK